MAGYFVGYDQACVDFVAEHPPQDAFFDLFAENWHQRRGASRGDSVQSSEAEMDLAGAEADAVAGGGDDQ